MQLEWRWVLLEERVGQFGALLKRRIAGVSTRVGGRCWSNRQQEHGNVREFQFVIQAT